jgi:hypothetical protein
MHYTRTQAGTAAVLNPKIEISRPMKALLISMVGGFDAKSYASRIRDGHDVPAMLEALVNAGYIRALPDTDTHTDIDSPPVERFQSHVARLQPQPQPQPERFLIPSESVSHRPLQDAVALMTDFVMNHLPGDALEMSFALEGLTSVTQLEASLRAYEAKIRHLGVTADQHLKQLKRILGHA